MAAALGVRALLSLSPSVILRCSFGLIPVQCKSTCLSRKLCSNPSGNNEKDRPVKTENIDLLQNLDDMGVDVNRARLRHPGVLRKVHTNEEEVAMFLLNKGVSREMVASIISRYPRSITRSVAHMEQRWELWRNIFKTDEEIATIVDRSPESFFRTTDNMNLEKNITYLISLGLDTNVLVRLLRTAPRTFSNSEELNKQKVEWLKGVCVDLGGEDPGQFVRAVITRNPYILIQSITRGKTNINILKDSIALSNPELLTFFQGNGARMLGLCSAHLIRNFNALQQKLDSLGCQEAELKKLIISYPMALFIGKDLLSSKLECLLKSGIAITQILDHPKALDYSTKKITKRLEELKKVNYDFKKNGIGILDSSEKRFDEKLTKLLPL